MEVFAQLTKVDEEKRLVYGRAVDESPDRSGEVFDYVTSKPYFEQWSAETKEATDGKSHGNLRAMHGKVAAGRLVDMQFNDRDRAIDVVAHVVDNNEWEKVLTGCYTGFSIGGSYVKKWDDAATKSDDGSPFKRYTAAPNELSLVDRPCIPTAKFLNIQKADGTYEQVEFHPAYTIDDIEIKAREICKAEDLDPDAGISGDLKKTPTWKQFARRAERILEKRDFSTKQRDAAAESGAAMPDGSFPIKNEEDFHNAVRLAGNAKNPDAARAHIKRRAKKLGLEEKIPDTWKTDMATMQKKDGNDTEGGVETCSKDGWSEGDMNSLHDGLAKTADSEDSKLLDTAKRHLMDNHVLMAKGDFPGHPFRGNQWQSGSSGKAVDKSMRARGHETASAHLAAAKSHVAAAHAAAKSGHEITQKYHETMAKFHANRYSKMTTAKAFKADNFGALSKALEKVKDTSGEENTDAEGAGTSLPSNKVSDGSQPGATDHAGNFSAMLDLHDKLKAQASLEQSEILDQARKHLLGTDLDAKEGEEGIQTQAKADVSAHVQGEQNTNVDDDFSKPNTSPVKSPMNLPAESLAAIEASRKAAESSGEKAKHTAAAHAHEDAGEAATAEGNDQLAAYHDCMSAFHRTYLDKADDVEYQVEGKPEDIIKLGRTMNREKLVVKDILVMVAKSVQARKAEARRANEKATILKMEAEGKVKKGMYTVGQLARVIQDLDDIRQSVNQEEKYEGDSASVLPEKMLDLVGMASQVLKDMVSEETNELLPEDGVDVDTLETGSAPQMLAMFDHFGAVRKLGARNSKKDQARIQHVHDLAAKLGAECTGQPGSDDNEPDTEVPEGTATDKAAAGNLQKLEERMLAEIAKNRDENKLLKAEIDRLKDEPRAAKGFLRVVNKSNDVDGTEVPSAESTIKPVIKGGVENEAATEIKKIWQGGGKPFLSGS